MKFTKCALFLTVAAVLSAGGLGQSSAQAQYKTYPGYYGATPSPSYYNLPNSYDRDTYLNPNPFPEPNRRGYEERSYAPYRPGAYAPAPAPYGYYQYQADYPTLGYYYGPGPFLYSHYGRSGRMAFRYGWW